MKSENFNQIDSNPPMSIIIGVHSHAPLEEFWNRTPKPKYAITIPCCLPQTISDLAPIEIYEDNCILSEKRQVITYKA
jgi:hypothetical protein